LSASLLSSISAKSYQTLCTLILYDFGSIKYKLFIYLLKISSCVKVIVRQNSDILDTLCRLTCIKLMHFHNPRVRLKFTFATILGLPLSFEVRITHRLAYVTVQSLDANIDLTFCYVLF